MCYIPSLCYAIGKISEKDEAVAFDFSSKIFKTAISFPAHYYILTEAC